MILHKYQALGNDFLTLDCINFQENQELLKSANFLDFVKQKSDRRRIGCDQFIVIENSTTNDAKIVFYNSDGSKAEACGNGTVAAGVYVGGFLGKKQVTLETDSGLANVEVDGNQATIELPIPKASILEDREKVDILNAVGYTLKVMNVNVGNPHCVLMKSMDINPAQLIIDIAENHWQEIGETIENMTHIFPYKTNVEFVTQLHTNIFQVYVWERGAGRTFACGTGACAVAFAMVKQGVADISRPIEILMEGSNIYGNGEPIIIKFGENSVFLTNHAFFEGKIEV